MVKRSRGKKHEEETEKQHVIMTGNHLFKGFTTEGVRNNDQKKSGKRVISVAWNSLRCGRFLAGRAAAPCTVTVKLAGLLPVVISNTYCSKTFKLIVFCQNNVLLFLSFFLLLFSPTSFNNNSQRRHFQRYISM